MQFIKAMEGGGSRTSGRSESDFNGKGALKKSKQVMEYLPTGRVVSKLEPCIMFFSSAGCSLGEKCHFSHAVGGGFNPLAGNNPNYGGKSLLCYKFFTDAGCVQNCPYAHGVEELCGPMSYMKIPDGVGPLPVCSFAEGLGPETSFGSSIRMTRSFCSPRSSTEGMNTWLLSKMSGARISLEDHESVPSMLKVNLEGTVEKVELATNMVRDHVASVGPAFAPPPAFASPPNSHARQVKAPGADGSQRGLRI